MAQGTWQLLPVSASIRQGGAQAWAGRRPAEFVARQMVLRSSRTRRQCRASVRDVRARQKIGAAGDRRDGLAGQAVTGGLPPGGSGHAGPRCSCRVPPSAGSTWAAARKAGPLRRATHASPGTRGHTATSPGPSLQSPPAWPRFRSPSLSLEDLGIGVRSAAGAADPRFNDILPGGPGGGEWADCTAMVTEVCAPHKVAS